MGKVYLTLIDELGCDGDVANYCKDDPCELWPANCTYIVGGFATQRSYFYLIGVHRTFFSVRTNSIDVMLNTARSCTRV